MSTTITDLISIVIPVYNVEQYLEDCIHSVLHQSYKNLEIFLIDDGSTDSSAEICRRYEEQDSRVHLIQKTNGGLSDARNLGIEKASGEYLLFVDSDDYISEDMVQILYENLIMCGAGIAMCDFYTGERSVHLHAVQGKNKVEFTSAEALWELYGKSAIQMTVAWNKLYRMSLFDGLRYPVGKIHEDEFLTYQVIARASKIVYIKQQLYFYRIRENSIMSEGVQWKTYDKVQAMEERVRFLRRYGDRALYQKALYSYMRFFEEFLRQVEVKTKKEEKQKQIYKNMLNVRRKKCKKLLPAKAYFKITLAWYFPEIFAKAKKIAERQKDRKKGREKDGE